MTARVPYRRLTLQLTPLLDLLLIVIFGQYLHVLHDQVSTGEVAQAAIVRAAEMDQQVILLNAALAQLRNRAEAAEAELVVSQSDLDRILSRQRVLGELMVTLFQLPNALVAQALDPSRSPAVQPSPAEQSDLQTLFAQFAQNSPGAMIDHLLEYAEIRKRCDVWEIYLDSSNVATIDMGRPDPDRMRLPINPEGAVDALALENDLYARYKALPQPKTLVIMLLTYDRGTRISMTQPLRAMLPRLVARMQADSIGRSRFEYADLGFKIK